MNTLTTPGPTIRRARPGPPSGRATTRRHAAPNAGSLVRQPAQTAALLAARLGRELLVFGAVGVASTAAYGLLFLLLRPAIGAVAANAVALLLTAVANTAANRRLTFGLRGRGSMLHDQIAGLVALGVALALTTAAVTALGAVAPHASPTVQLAVLVIANALATVVRFALLRSWVAADRSALPATSPSVTIQE